MSMATPIKAVGQLPIPQTAAPPDARAAGAHAQADATVPTVAAGAPAPPGPRGEEPGPAAGTGRPRHDAVVRTLGSVALLLGILFAENAATHVAMPLLAAGFAVFSGRVALAWLASTRTGRRHAATLAKAGWLATAAVAVLAAMVAASGGLWGKLATTAVFLVLFVLFFTGGLLSADFFLGLARAVPVRPAAPSAKALRRGAIVVIGLAALTFAEYLAARNLFAHDTQHATTYGFGFVTWGLMVATIVAALLLVAAWRGYGAARLAQRQIRTALFLALASWFAGYALRESLALTEAATLPLLAIAVGALDFFSLVFEGPEKTNEHRLLPHAALWDVFLSLAFALLFVVKALDDGGASPGLLLFFQKYAGLAGLALGAVLVPMLQATDSPRWPGRRRAMRQAAGCVAGLVIVAFLVTWLLPAPPAEPAGLDTSAIAGTYGCLQVTVAGSAKPCGDGTHLILDAQGNWTYGRHAGLLASADGHVRLLGSGPPAAWPPLGVLPGGKDAADGLMLQIGNTTWAPVDDEATRQAAGDYYCGQRQDANGTWPCPGIAPLRLFDDGTWSWRDAWGSYGALRGSPATLYFAAHAGEAPAGIPAAADGILLFIQDAGNGRRTMEAWARLTPEEAGLVPAPAEAAPPSVAS